MNDYLFARNLIKGRIAETIFELMFQSVNQYKLIRFGYEHTAPDLVSHSLHTDNNKAVLDSISDSPDYIEIDSQNRITLVEVKYHKQLKDIENRVLTDAQDIIDRWPEAWLFVVTPEGFFFDSAQNAIENNGFIKPLSPDTIPQERQAKYLEVVTEFIQ